MIARASDAEVAIIGLGVIGGSAALRLQQRGTALRAYSTSERDCAQAAAAGLTITPTLDDAVRDVGLVLIAVPLDRVSDVAEKVLGAAPATATILHAGSLQREETLRELPEVMARVIGTHPLAGSHRSGFAAARADMFREATVYVERRATARQREDAELFWSLAGARRIMYATASEHDDAMAWMSHLPQLASTALANALAGHPITNDSFHPGPGARDATRLAMSTLEMWQPLLDRAPEQTHLALRALEASVQHLRMALESRDWGNVREIWERGRAWRAAAEPSEEG